MAKFQHPAHGRRSKQWPDISMRALGTRLGISGSYVSRLLSGKRGGSAKVVLALAKELGIRPEDVANRQVIRGKGKGE
jgi:transcriptional regulator with XRE-family HTH domain